MPTIELDADSSAIWHIILDAGKATEAQLADLIERAETANAGQPISFFEMTTAIALETQKGEFAMGLALGLILLLIALGINAGMHVIRLPRKRSPGPAGGAN